MAPIRPHVQSVEVGYRAIDRPPIFDHPSAELFDRLQVEIERLRADAALLFRVGSQVVQERHHLACGNVAVVPETAAVEDAPRPSGQ